jgi:hypothetical protein
MLPFYSCLREQLNGISLLQNSNRAPLDRMARLFRVSLVYLVNIHGRALNEYFSACRTYDFTRARTISPSLVRTYGDCPTALDGRISIRFVREKLPSLTFSRRPKTRSGAKYGGWASGDYSTGRKALSEMSPLRFVLYG